MSIMKRATKELASLGYPHLTVRKGLYGYSLSDIRYASQEGAFVRKTTAEVVADALAGRIPRERSR